ncbi:BrxE family protein [Sneathiella sp. P13V-1]|uniref:BrxE family protein n=1 Tax=Sneathiella sp. P13V-1 TaxID=2697366 RepID=UPI00187BA3E1|nr:BrxE family protein [Sneathiella sp. P13V-1]MBE7635958.1 BrxE family protein [Sneathiella sp. P13V-1]
MNNNVEKLIVELRLLVGFLGEKSQGNWWGSNFIGTSSEAFLVPIFSRTTMFARYHGVCEAAMLVHDEHIGVGTNFHLYRMPDSVERGAAKALADSDFQQRLNDVLGSSEVAQTRLVELVTTDTNIVEGPVVLGTYADAGLNQRLHQAASHYLRAFKEGYKCFPYMREAQ